MKFTRPIEPGVLSAFRLFTGVRLTLLLVNAALELVFHGWPTSPPTLFLLSLLDASVLLLYLSWDWLAGRLKSWHLPLGILLAAAVPMIEQHVFLDIYFNNLQQSTALLGAWQMILVLLIPLFIIGWQYSFRQVVLFSLLTSLLDIFPLVLAVRARFLQPALVYPFVGILFIRMVVFLFVGYMVVKLMNTQRGLRSELASANNRLAQYAGALEQLATSRERNRLARELHDVLAHTLSGVAVELEAVKALWDADPSRAQVMLQRSLHATRSGLTETRRALQALRASPIEDLGLSLAVRGLAESAASRSSLKLQDEIGEELPEVPPEVEQCVYRIAQEALANISEHAGAQVVRVSLVPARNGSEAPSGLKLVICDDGRGFDPSGALLKEQFGLRGMRERAEGIGARLEITSQPGGGTLVEMEYGGAG
jgi:signal transduction histidine kinase